MKIIYLLLFYLTAQLTVAAQFTEKTFEELGIIEGKWFMQKKSSALLESWNKISTHEYAGKSWLIKKSDSVLSETLVLSFDNGAIKYTSTVTGQNEGKAVSFTLTKAENNTYTFENPQHDFPKRIIYQFVSDHELVASIDDGKVNTTEKVVYTYQKQ